MEADGILERQSRHLMRLRRAEGRSTAGVPSIEYALAVEFTAPEQDYIRYQQSLAIEGNPDRVRAGLEEIAESYSVGELLVITITHDYAHRLRSYELLAQACGLTRD